MVAISSADTINVALNYNFNGVWNGDGERMDPVTEASGFRSFSDRALDFSAGIPAHAVLDRYVLNGGENELDLVHLGNRNLTDGGNWAFGAAPDGDRVGIQPDWLADPNQTGPPATTTSLGPGILLDANSNASFIFHISNGGGDFDVRLGFSSGADVVATLGGGDWYGGNGLPAGAFDLFAGMGNVDDPESDADLGLWEGVVDLTGEAGRALTSISLRTRPIRAPATGSTRRTSKDFMIPRTVDMRLCCIALLGALSGSFADDAST